jgi:feruloyl esterase
LPQPASGRDELFSALREWVEHGVAPSRFDLRSQDASVTLPICAWPRKAVYKGSGSIAVAGSYGCD